MDEAAPIALQTVMDYLLAQEADAIRLVRFVLFGRQAYQVYQRALNQLVGGESAR